MLLRFFRPRMTLKRFETAYHQAAEKHGAKNAEIIATSMKATTEALGLPFTAPQEAEAQLEGARRAAIAFEMKSTNNLSWFRNKMVQIKRIIGEWEYRLNKAYERNMAKYRNRATQSNERAKQIEEIRKLL